MNDFVPPSDHGTHPGRAEVHAGLEPLIGGSSGSAAQLDQSIAVSAASQASLRRLRRMLRDERCGWIVAFALICAAIGLSASLAASNSAAAVRRAPDGKSAGGPGPIGGASNARSAPAQGGAFGTVDSVSKSSFTLTTSANQKVTVHEASSTKYEKGTTSTSASAVTKDESVLVLGITNSTTITAGQVIVGYKFPSDTSAAKVVPFQRGAPTASKQIGQIPANWSQGSGTIVGGTVANEATEAALAAYPGGIVDRVVKLSDGEYNVHYIGVNWPHHVFVNASFKVVGAL